MSLFDLLVQIQKRRSVREIQALMKRLEEATKKEANEDKQNGDKTTAGDSDTAVNRDSDSA